MMGGVAADSSAVLNSAGAGDLPAISAQTGIFHRNEQKNIILRIERENRAEE